MFFFLHNLSFDSVEFECSYMCVCFPFWRIENDEWKDVRCLNMYSFQSVRFFFSPFAAYNVVNMNANDRDVLYLVDWLVTLFNFFSSLIVHCCFINVRRNDNIR